jgi:glycosyltransferase involved in cell wall biosynthesis
MTVQIFIPTFNRSAKLARAIRSVQGQSWRELDVVVLDNHSEDDTPAIVTAFMAADPRISYIRHEQNIGMFPNVNAIRALVTAEHFSVLTDDDEYEACFVETALACFRKDERIRFVACNAPTLQHGVTLKSQLDSWREGFYRANTTVFRCLSGQYPLITNCLLKAELAQDFVFHEDLGNVSDGMLLTCLFAKYDAYVCKVTTGYWDNHDDNASTLYRPDPITLVNRPIRESRHYKAFCRKNHIFMRGRLLLWLKKFLTVLMAADQSDFAHVRDASEMKGSFSSSTIAVLWLLDRLKVVRLFLLALSLFRRLNKAWIAWRES